MLDCESTSFDDERKEKIFKLACAMGDTYDSENDREKEFENKLNNFLEYNIDGKDRKKRNCNEEVRFDALVKLEYSKSEKDAFYDAHSFCAEHQIAPKIIHYSDINSGYKFIVMEYLDVYETINSLFSKVKKEDLKEIKNSIKVAVGLLHDKNFVHGDF
nr:11112_t:CDS:2 [Entrophospora candida]